MIKQNYKAANYTVEIEVPGSPNDVFGKLIKLKKWWPEDFEGEDIQLDSEFILTTGDSHYSKNKVIEFVPDKKLVWIATESIRKTDNFDWTGTKMIFELTPAGDSTLVEFTYDGVVLENETGRLVQICDSVLKEMFYDYITIGKEK
jgi:hypothetical protein